MRLTLRTMLCYLDDVLDPADAKELGSKIEESEYATNLVHRIRTSMRRLRLGAPAVSGEAMGFDPNTVADYLDNTLSAEQVPDFERVCLDENSEDHLAEVAACHQILTLVLGEPAEVSPSMRERVYGLEKLDDQQLADAAMAGGDSAATEQPLATTTVGGNGQSQRRVDPPAGPNAAEGAVVAKTGEPPVQPARAQREKPEVPEYLRKSNSQRVWPMALTALLLIILIGGIALTIWPRDNHDNVALNNPNGEPDDDGTPNVPTGDGEEPEPLFNVDDQSPTVPADDGTAPSDGGNQNNNGDNGNAIIADGSPPIDIPPVENGGATDPVVDGGGPAPPIDEGAPEDGTDGGLARIDPPVDGGAVDPVLPPVDKVAGHFTSTSAVMAAWDKETASWQRLPPRAPLKPGARLRSLPTYRPQIILENDIQITFAGEGIAAVGNPVDESPSITISAGRAVVATMGKAGNQIAIDAGGRKALITMANVEAVVALSVAPFHAQGADPLAELAHVEVIATVTGGQIQWQAAGAEPVTLDVGQSLSMIDDALPSVQTIESPPRWARTSDVSDIDRLASATLEPLLDEERPLEIALAERSEHPRVEVRSLAARCLGSLDKFDALIDTLNDESLKSYWSPHFDHLQAALARGGETAARVREAIERRKGDEAERVYRLLQGYSPAQLKAGDDKLLVEYLKHDSLDVRVLAIQNLRQITNRTFGYHAYLPEARRRTPVRQWEQAADSNSIVYLNPPAELPKRAPAAP